MPSWISFATVKDAILALIAVYGAILSTINYRQAARRDRRQILVRVNTVVPTYPSGLGVCLAKLEVVNAGHRSVTVSGLFLEGPDRSRLFSPGSGVRWIPDTSLPITLSDGGTAQVYYAYHDVGIALLEKGWGKRTKLIPVCEDSIGTTYRGEPWEVDPNEIARM